MVVRSRLWHAPLIILLWQAAPLALEQDPVTGKYRLYVGAEAGQFENRDIACDGSVTNAVPVDLRRIGAALEAWVGSRARAQVAVGGGDRGPHAAMRLNAEWRIVGMGLGAWGGENYEDGNLLVAPSAYLRFGNLDQWHVVMDLLPPDLGPVAGGWARIGVGYRQGIAEGTGGVLGLTVPPFADNRYTGAGFAQVHTPVGRSTDLMVRVLLGAGSDRATWGAGLGARIALP